jgi:heptosyltransferase-2
LRKLLIVKLGAIGDVLRTTALLPGLKEKHDPCEIDWLTSAPSKPVLTGNPFINRLYTWEDRELLGSYDMAIGLEDDVEACRLVAALPAAIKVGAFLQNGRITYTPSAWFDMSAVSKYGIDQANVMKKENTKTYQQHMAELLGIKVSPYVFSLTPDEVGYGGKVLRDLGLGAGEKIIGVNTGAGKRWQMKSWGLEQTIELVNKLKKELGVAALILGGEDERERNARISSETGMPDAGVHSLRHFAAIINQCPVVLSSDSLAMHFAIALRKRVVAFFGPTSPAEIELYGLGEKLTPEMDCLVCYKRSCDRKHNCMETLSVETVLQAIKRQFTFA